MSCYIVGLRTDILLCIILCICPFFSSPYFCQRYLHKIECSYLVYRIKQQVVLWDREQAFFNLFLSIYGVVGWCDGAG